MNILFRQAIMRSWLTLAVGCCFAGCFAATTVAEGPTVRVTCPAVSYDDHDERGVNGPDGPHPVVLMVVAKTVNGDAKSEFKKRRPSREEDQPVELKIERVLFGSPPGEKIVIPPGYGHFPENAHSTSHIYGFVSSRRQEKIGYDADDYYLYDRTYSLDKLAKVEALARARLDRLVLSQLAIVVGKPNAEAKKLATEDDDPFAPSTSKRHVKALVTIERVLHGPLQAGEQISVSADHDPIPLTGDGPFIYFLEETRKPDDGQNIYRVETRWSLDALDTVNASLARRQDYPIKEFDDDGEKVKQQEILFLGSRAAALELLQEDRNPLEILGARRILSDDQDALPDVVKLIEKHLWQPRIEDVADFQWQENLIKILAILEDHRTDGHIVRLIDEMLTKAERGASFPLKVVEREENDGLPRRLRYGQSYDVASNHSLGWLLLTLDEREAARLFGERLIKLRDLAAYGWKDEAQIALDELHIEDHLALAKVEPRSKDLPTKKWPAGFRGDGLFSEQLAFSPDGKRFAAVSYSTSRVWNTIDWSLVSEFEAGGSARRVKFAPDGESLFIASGGGKANLARINWRTGKSLQTYAGLNWADQFDLTDDGRWLVVSDVSPDALFVFDAQSGKLVSQQPKESWSELAWQPGGKKFLGRLISSWTIGDADNDRRELSFATYSVAWAKSGLWSLEKGAKIEVKPAKPGKAGVGFAPALPPPGVDPFGQSPNPAPPAFAPPPFNPPAVKSSRPPPSTEDLPPLPSPDSFGGRRSDHLSALRLRQLDEKNSITLERKLPFTATELLVSDDRQTVVVLNDQQAEVFAAPDWKSVATWKVPLNAAEASPYGNRIQQYILSPDGKWLALVRERSYPQLRDVRTGKVVPLGAGHSNEIVGLNFADPNTLRTRDANGQVIRWNATTGAKLPTQTDDVAATPEGLDSHRRSHHSGFVGDDGRIWSIAGRGGGAYDRYSSFEISVYPKGYEPPGDPFEDPPKAAAKKPAERVEPELLGEIETRWNQLGPAGLVPGGQYLHIGTQIFTREGLKPISAANVHGEIDQIQFTSDGLRYLIVTTERESRPAPLGLGYFREEVSQSVRLHDTASGQTLHCIPTHSVKLLAIAPDQSRLAIVNDRQEVQVWKLGK